MDFSKMQSKIRKKRFSSISQDLEQWSVQRLLSRNLKLRKNPNT